VDVIKEALIKRGSDFAGRLPLYATRTFANPSRKGWLLCELSHLMPTSHLLLNIQ